MHQSKQQQVWDVGLSECDALDMVIAREPWHCIQLMIVVPRLQEEEEEEEEGEREREEKAEAEAEAEEEEEEAEAEAEEEDDEESRRFWENLNAGAAPPPGASSMRMAPERRGHRWEPPLPAPSRLLKDLVIQDNSRVDIRGQPAPAISSRIGDRADVETLELCATELQPQDIPLPDKILWCFYLHKLHRRTPTATALRSLLETPRRCTLAAVESLHSELSALFTDDEIDFDIARRRVGGLRTWRRLMPQHDSHVKFAEDLAALPPCQWAISKQHELLKLKKGFGKYLRGHGYRAVALLAVVFGASERPPFTMACWEILMELMPGSASGAKMYKLASWSSARTFCAAVNADLCGARHAQGFDLYDATCCVCLTLGTKHTYHDDHGKPFEVRLVKPCIETVQANFGALDTEAAPKLKNRGDAKPKAVSKQKLKIRLKVQPKVAAKQKPGVRRKAQPKAVARPDVPLAPASSRSIAKRRASGTVQGAGSKEPPAKRLRGSARIKSTGWKHVVEEKDRLAVCGVCSRTASWKNRSRLASDSDCLGRPESKEHAQVRKKAIAGVDWAITRINACCAGVPGRTVHCTSYICTVDV